MWRADKNHLFFISDQVRGKDLLGCAADVLVSSRAVVTYAVSVVSEVQGGAVCKAGEAAGHRRLWVVRREEEKLLSCDTGDQTGLAFIYCAQTTHGYSSGPQSS